jgi:hypothetical protein
VTLVSSLEHCTTNVTLHLLHLVLQVPPVPDWYPHAQLPHGGHLPQVPALVQQQHAAGVNWQGRHSELVTRWPAGDNMWQG